MSTKGRDWRTLEGALPPYWGGKRDLCALIFALLAQALPPAVWPRLRFLDPMCGGGAVALYAKAMGFQVVASDAAERGALVARALVANSTTRLAVADLASPARPPAVVALPIAVAERLTAEQARACGRLLAMADAAPEPRRSLLRLLLVRGYLRLYPMSSPAATDAAAAAAGDYDRITPRRLAHYLRARDELSPARLWSLAQAINAGVMPGMGEALCGDARAVTPAVGADVVYLDPPYQGTTKYSRSYELVDALLGDRAAPTTPSIDELLEACGGVEWVVISYGGPRASLEGVRTLVARHRTVVSATAVPYPHLRPLASEVTNASNQEFIVVARR